MNIYNEDETVPGVILIDAAARELRTVGSIVSESARRAAVAEINTAALLDIAASLRIVAAEALAAMPEASGFGQPYGAGEFAEDEADDGDFLVEGDLVAVEGMTEPGEILKFGQSEGALYADVIFPDGTQSRAWLTSLSRLVGDERDDDAMQEASEVVVETFTEADATGNVRDVEAELTLNADGSGSVREIGPEDLVDDIDDDFDGDTHTAAATALDVLKENEAARKAAKKSGSKKGSKK